MLDCKLASGWMHASCLEFEVLVAEACADKQEQRAGRQGLVFYFLSS
jgi:hypothetical protein